MAQNKSKLKKALSVIVTVLAALIFACALCLFALTIVAKSNGKQVKIFGYSFSVVLSDSMTPEIKVHELVTVKHCSIEKAKIGDNVVYIAQSGERAGEQIIHKVREVGEDDKGVYVITRGVKAGAKDDPPVYAENFVGIGVAHSAFLGAFVVRLSPVYAGWTVCIISWACIIVFLFAVWLGVRQIRKLVKLSKTDGDAPTESADADGSKGSDGGENS